jgi:hypothetical protein
MSTTTTISPPDIYIAFNPPERDVALRVNIYHSSKHECFLTLHAREYPIGGGGRSGVKRIRKTVIIDACRILTGLYQARFLLYDKIDNIVRDDELVPPGEYDLQVVDESGALLEYCLYKNFYTWRPPTRAQVPCHWFTNSSPQAFNREDDTPPWAGLQADMHDHMSTLAKAYDDHRCTLTRVVSPATVEGAPVVPVEEKVFVSLISALNKNCWSHKHSTRSASSLSSYIHVVLFH